MRMAKRNRLLRLRADIGTIAPRAYAGDLDSAWRLLGLLKDHAMTLRLAPSGLWNQSVSRPPAQRSRPAKKTAL